MDENTKIEETLDEMQKRLTPEPEEYRSVRTKTHEELVEERIQLSKEVAEMEARLPKFRGVYGGEPVEVTDAEWNAFGKLRFIWVDDESPVTESDRGIILELLEQNKIKKMF